MVRPNKPDDQNVNICLRSSSGNSKIFSFTISILKTKSKFLAHQLSCSVPGACIEIPCSSTDYNHYLDLLASLQVPVDSLLDSWKSAKSALGILQASIALHCEEITQSCIQYLEAIPWDEEEEEEISRVVPKLGPVAVPILARIQPVNMDATKNVFIAAVRFAMSVSGPCPPFQDEIKTSAQEQVEYMLGEDEDMPMVTAGNDVKLEVRIGLSKTFSVFREELSSLISDPDLESEDLESRILRSFGDVEWLCRILPKMDLMRDFVSCWDEISDHVLHVIEDKKLDSALWSLKLKLIELTGNVLDAVGYGNVILPAPRRVHLLKAWLPYLRKQKPVLDSIGNDEMGYPYRMDEDMCQNIEGAITALVLGLPSNDQADILAEWMENEQLKYPNLSEAFEIWCYRTKSAKRRLIGKGLDGLDRVSNTTVSSDSISA